MEETKRKLSVLQMQQQPSDISFPCSDPLVDRLTILFLLRGSAVDIHVLFISCMA
jgi:hypothetical protein